MKGFTLVELLVVLVIVGITLALVGLNLMPDDARIVRNEAQRLALLLEQASEEAVAATEPIAWSAEGGRYRFWHRDGAGKWVSDTRDPLWRERSLAEGVTIRALRINHLVAKEGDRLIFSPAGFGLPFEIELARGEAHVLISGDALGKVSLKEAG